MKVYVLIEQDYEQSVIHGVYSSREAAQKAQPAIESEFRGTMSPWDWDAEEAGWQAYTWRIDEFELDQP